MKRLINILMIFSISFAGINISNAAENAGIQKLFCSSEIRCEKDPAKLNPNKACSAVNVGGFSLHFQQGGNLRTGKYDLVLVKWENGGHIRCSFKMSPYHRNSPFISYVGPFTPSILPYIESRNLWKRTTKKSFECVSSPLNKIDPALCPFYKSYD